MPDETPPVVAADAADEVTEVVEETGKEVTPDPPAETDAPEWAKALEARVNALGEQVATMIAGAHEPPPAEDETPERKPWTHRGWTK